MYQFQVGGIGEMTSSMRMEAGRLLNSVANAHPLQHPLWGDEEDGNTARDQVFIAGHKAGRLVLFGRGVKTPLFSRMLPWGRGLTILRGPAFETNEDFLEWTAWMIEDGRRLGLAFVELIPDWLAEPAQLPVQELVRRNWSVVPRERPRMTLRLRLDLSERELIAGFSSTARNLVRRAGREDIAISAASTKDDIEAFMQAYQGSVNRKAYTPTPAAVLIAVLSNIVSGRQPGVVLLSHKNGLVLGGIVVICAGRRAEYAFGGQSAHPAVEPASIAASGYALQWVAMRWAKAAGCVEYDLGGFQGTGGNGVDFFKTRFGASMVTFGPAVRYILRPDLVRLGNMWRRLRAR